jgi:hypothetical protein
MTLVLNIGVPNRMSCSNFLMICQENAVNGSLVMFRSLSRYRAIIALLTAVMWAFGAVAGPAHAAEEEFHHATQHQDDAASSEGQPAEENSIHPEHATHCHSGACHFHAMSRGAADQASIILTANRLLLPRSEAIRQAIATAIFHPPRV